MSSDAHLDRWARRCGEICSCGAGLIALFALATWVFDEWRAGALGPDYVPMAPSTALLILLLGDALFVRSRWPAAAATKRFGYVAVAVVGFFSLLVWAQWLLGVENPIENWLARTRARVGGIPVGHMSPATATASLVIALALLFELPPFSRRRRFRYVATAFSLAVVWIGLVVLAGYAAGAPPLYGSGAVPMALLTAMALVLLGAGTLATSWSDNWLLRVLARDPLQAPPSRPGRFVGRLPASLRGRLLLLGVIGCLAGTGLMSWMAAERYAAAGAEVTKDTLHLTQLAAHQLERLIEGERYLLISLSKQPAIRNLDAPASSALLAAIKQELPLYANFSAFKANGEAFASALPLARPVNAADLSWFQRAIETRGFVVGEFQTGRISGKQVLVAAYPVLDDAGQVRAVLDSALDLPSLNAIIKSEQLPPAAAIIVIDRKGTVLAHDPEPERWVGRVMTEADNVKTILSRREGTAEVAGVDGVKRIYSFMPVDGADDGVFVSIGIPKQVALAGVRREFLEELFGLGLLAGLAVLVVLSLAEVSVLRPVNALVATARQLAGGDLSARTGGPYGAGEFDQLRSALDDMAGALEQREAERKLADQAARLTHQRLRRFVDANIVGVVIAGADGSIREANDYYLRLIGFTREELEQGKVDWRAITPPEWLAVDEQAIRELHERGTCTPYEKEYVRRDGTRVPVFLVDALLPGPDEQIAAFALDITERKRAEEEIARVASFPQVNPNPITEVDAAGHIHYANPSAARLLPTLEAEGFRHPWLAGLEPLLAAFREAGGGSTVREIKNGELWYSQTLLYLPAIDRVRIYAYEITERVRAQKEIEELNAELEQRVAERTAALQETNAELEAFAYSVSHDLRAPLLTVQGFATALLEDYRAALDATAQDYLDRMVAGAEQIDRLIQDLLAYSRLGRGELRIEAVSLDSVVKHALALLEGVIRTSVATITVESPLGELLAHRSTLVQVVVNLLANAIKFVAPGVAPRVRVWAELPEPNGRARLWVDDNGIGILPEHRDRIFRVFERLHGVESYPGTGIGLAIVRKGVERMGGRAGVESAPGGGSRFWIELPAAAKNTENREDA